jgi:FkbM family methyltransferase
VKQLLAAIKKLFKASIGLYLLPCTLHPKVFHFVKGVFFVDPSEHLHRTARHIDRVRAGSSLNDSIMIDVGAASGSVALYFSQKYEELNIYCIEPNPNMQARLKTTANGRSKIFLKNMALGNTSGELTLHVTANQLSSSLNELNQTQIDMLAPEHRSWLKGTEEVKVRVSTLDAEFQDFPKILLLKLDTQGTELSVLQGGLEVLKRTKFVLAEMNNHDLYKDTCKYFEVDDFLRAQSFKLVDLIVTYHTGEEVQEYDALYENTML